MGQILSLIMTANDNVGYVSHNLLKLIQPTCPQFVYFSISDLKPTISKQPVNLTICHHARQVYLLRLTRTFKVSRSLQFINTYKIIIKYNQLSPLILLHYEISLIRTCHAFFIFLIIWPNCIICLLGHWPNKLSVH